MGALFVGHWPQLITLALLAALVGARSTSVRRPVGQPAVTASVIACLGILAVLIAAMAPASHYYGGLPPPWDQIVLTYVIVCAIVALGWSFGRSLRRLDDPIWCWSGWSDQRRGTVTRALTVAVGAGIVATVVRRIRGKLKSGA